jgi:hypothetical protein
MLTVDLVLSIIKELGAGRTALLLIAGSPDTSPELKAQAQAMLTRENETLARRDRALDRLRFWDREEKGVSERCSRSLLSGWWHWLVVRRTALVIGAVLSLLAARHRRAAQRRWQLRGCPLWPVGVHRDCVLQSRNSDTMRRRCFRTATWWIRSN